MPNRISLLTRWFLIACLCLSVSGCGGGGGETSSGSSDSDSVAAPAAPTMNGSTPASSASALTPDGTAKAFITALKNNQLGEIWDLLPASYQQDINGLVRDFGRQVDAELWDQSFALLNRYAKVLIDKHEMALETPQSQQSFAMLGSMGLGDTSWMTKDKIKAFSEPSNAMMVAFLDGELSSSAKLKSFDGKAFLSGTLGPMLKNLRTLIELGVKEVQQNPQLQSNMQAQMIASQMNLNQMFDQISITAGSVNGDNAVVNFQMHGQPAGSPLNMTRVEGKWIPTAMAAGFKQGIQMAKAMVPMAVQGINGYKEQVLPMLTDLEPLMAALEQATTQDEFNVAYSSMEQAMNRQMAGLAGGVPGFDPSMLGGGPAIGIGGGSAGQSLSAVTVIVNQELNDAQLKKLILELEKLTDSPEESILLPQGGASETLIKLTPVGDFQGFVGRIQFAEVLDQNPSEKSVTIGLNTDFGR